MWKRLQVKYPLLLSDFNETWILSTDLRRKLKYQVSSKSVHWELSCSMKTDRQTDMKLIVAFRNSANAPNNFDIESMEEVILRQRKWVSCMTMTCSSSSSPFLPTVFACSLLWPLSRSAGRLSLQKFVTWRGERNRKMALWVGSICRTSFRGICIARCRAEWESKR